MKIFNLFFALLLAVQIQAQHDCGLQTDPSPEVLFFNSQLEGIDFFDENNCLPLELKCNFIFLRRDNGTGTFSPNHPIVQELITDMNEKWAAIHDYDNCQSELDYPVDSKVRVKVQNHYINNTLAWDYYGQALTLPNYYQNMFCPDNINNGANSVWPALWAEVQDFAADDPNSINFFFVENGGHLDYLEANINNPNVVPWSEEDAVPIFSGCSMLDRVYDSEVIKFILMTDLYTEYYKRINFKEVYYPHRPDNTAEEIAGWHLGEMPATLNHELGHLILDQSHTEGCKNLMSAGDRHRTHLSPAQLNRLHNTIMTSNVHQSVNCAALSSANCRVRVIADEEINKPMSIYGDLYIEEGVTLTVKSTMFMAEKSAIKMMPNAKLIVDGGVITSDCDIRWEGIQVSGGNSDFDVRIFNNSVIENTSNAAVSMFPPLDYQEAVNHGNGIIQAVDSEFNNVRKAVEFMAFQPAFNSSYVRNCVQNGGKGGVSNWNCLGITVSESTFNDITGHAISVSDGSVNLFENTFYSEDEDVLIRNGVSTIGSIIEDNAFNAPIGINQIGTSYSKTIIKNNVFNCYDTGILMEGDNHYLIQFNDFRSWFGVICENNGTHENIIQANDFENEFVGISIYDENGNLTFLDNCFNTQYTDVEIEDNCSYFVGNSNRAAGNCFTHDGNTNSAVPDIVSNYTFEYYRPKDLILDCYDVFEPGIIKKGAPIVPSFGCGTKNRSQSETGKGDKRRYRETEVRNVFDQYSPKAQAILTADFEKASTFIEGTREERNKQLFDLKLIKGELLEASKMLEILRLESPELSDYWTIQEIRMKWLMSENRVAEEETLLRRLKQLVAQKSDFAPQAKSVYFLISGEKLPYEKRERLARKEGLETPEESKVQLFPNPASSNLVIQSTQALTFEIQLYSVDGQLMLSRADNLEQAAVDISQLPEGLYIVQLVFSNGERAYKNFIKS